jgi:hypothetical protein
MASIQIEGSGGAIERSPPELERDQDHYSEMALNVAVPQTFHRIHKTLV